PRISLLPLKLLDKVQYTFFPFRECESGSDNLTRFGSIRFGSVESSLDCGCSGLDVSWLYDLACVVHCKGYAPRRSSHGDAAAQHSFTEGIWKPLMAGKVAIDCCTSFQRYLG